MTAISRAAIRPTSILDEAARSFAPSGGIDVGTHLAVEIDHRGIGTPGAAKEHVRLAGFGSESAMIENEGGLLIGEVLALGGEVAAGGVQRAVDLAVVEYSVAIAVDEVHIARDDAMSEVRAG